MLAETDGFLVDADPVDRKRPTGERRKHKTLTEALRALVTQHLSHCTRSVVRPHTKKRRIRIKTTPRVFNKRRRRPLAAAVPPLRRPRADLLVFWTMANDAASARSRLSAALLPFQREGVAKGVAWDGRVLLGDEMGLGKTLQAIAIAMHYHDEWPCLVLCPTSMVYSWAEELEKWCFESKKQHLFCLFPNAAPPLLPYVQNLIQKGDGDGAKKSTCSVFPNAAPPLLPHVQHLIHKGKKKALVPSLPKCRAPTFATCPTFNSKRCPFLLPGDINLLRSVHNSALTTSPVTILTYGLVKSPTPLFPPMRRPHFSHMSEIEFFFFRARTARSASSCSHRSSPLASVW